MSKDSGIIIGIDLGTTNSCVAYKLGNQVVKIIPNDLGANTTPSVVSFKDNGEKNFGVSAKRQISKNVFFEVKRLIGRKKTDKEVESFKTHVPYQIVASDNGDAWVATVDKAGNVLEKFSPSQISSYLLQYLKKTAENHLGCEIKEAVITVPAYFNDAQRQATKDAAKIAGLEVKRIINEPTAAALAYGLDEKADSKTIVVYDLGGGTFDVTVLELGQGVFEVKATNGDTNLGGSDFDNKIVEYLLNEYKLTYGSELKDSVAIHRVKDAAEKAKIELSSTISTEVNLPFLFYENGEPRHLAVNLTRAKVENLCEDLIKATIDPCVKALKDAKIDISEVDEVVLVGGMTRMPKIKEVVKEFFKKEPHCGVNPDEVVAVGAAIQGAILRGDIKDVVLVDVTPLSLGIETAGGVMTVMIKRNTHIPAKEKQVFSTYADNQTQVQIKVFQGERPMANDNKFLGEFVLDGIAPAPRGIPQIEVSFKIDSDGILKVEAEDRGTQKKHEITIRSSGGLSEEEINRMMEEAKQNEESDKKKAELAKLKNDSESLINSIEKALKEHGEKLTEQNKKEVEVSLEKLKNLQSDDVAEWKNAHDELSKASMEIGRIVYEQQQKNQANNEAANSNEGSETNPSNEGK